MNDYRWWDGVEAAEARSAALHNLCVYKDLMTDTDVDGYPRIALYRAFGFDDLKHGVNNWEEFRRRTTPEMLPALKALAGPNGYTILKAMIAKRS